MKAASIQGQTGEKIEATTKQNQADKTSTLEEVKETPGAAWRQRLTDLQRSVFGFWEFSLIQALPALEELLDDGAVRADDVEACDVGSAGKDSVQAHVGEALRAKSIVAAKKEAFKPARAA